jgi:hypothetical protein
LTGEQLRSKYRVVCASPVDLCVFRLRPDPASGSSGSSSSTGVAALATAATGACAWTV